MNKNIIINFYLGLEKDDTGRFIEDIWKFSHEKLENCHDYIQWLFPLEEKSAFNMTAPILNKKQIEIFRNSEVLQKRLKRSYELMLDFYGFKIIEDKDSFKLVKSFDYDFKKKVWLNYRNHNYLRITRILKCLVTLGLHKEAEIFFDCLSEIYKNEEKVNIGNSYDFWTNAVSKK